MSRSMRVAWVMLVSSSIWMGCSTDIEVNADWQDITIVYGLLDASDTAHYIKVNRAFLPDKESALDIGQIKDSIFYQDATVTLKELETNTLLTLELVDGNQEGHVKETGTFLNAPNYLYKTTFPLTPSNTYEVTVTKAGYPDTATATTQIIGKISLVQPRDSTVWQGTLPMEVAWLQSENAAIYQLIATLHYREFSLTDPGTIIRPTPIRWQVFGNITHVNCGQIFCHELKVKQIVGIVAGRVEPNPDVSRAVDYLQLELVAGGEELQKAILTEKTKISSIVQVRALNDYTNVINGNGIFSSRSDTALNYILLGNSVNDSIANDPRTEDLGF